MARAAQLAVLHAACCSAAVDVAGTDSAVAMWWQPTKQPGGAINIFVCCIHYKCKTKYTEETMFDTRHMSVHSKCDKISLHLWIDV